MFSSLLHVTPAELSEAIPGKWEVLDNPYEPILDPTFGRSTKGLGIDCVVTVLHSEHAIEVSKPVVVWIRHHPYTKAGKAKKTISANLFDPESGPVLPNLSEAVSEVAAASRKSWRTCRNCSSRLPRGYMQTEDICMSCAPEILGILY